MDEVLGWCRGCGRSNDEIAEWASAEDSRRRAIWTTLPERIDALGIAITRLPWRHGQIAEFVARALRQRSGAWVFGSHFARAEFMCRPNENCEISVSGDRISALSERAALQLTIDENVRALQLRADHKQDGFRAIFLAVLKARANMPVATTVTPLGRDEDALRPECRNEHWFDLGLGRADLRFCVRTADSQLRDRLNRASGLPLSDFLQDIGSLFGPSGPTRIVQSPIGRAEIYSSALSHGGRTHDGPSIQITPEQLASGHALPPGIDLPPVYALGATFYPQPARQGAEF